jgi:hypothetical protein
MRKCLNHLYAPGFISCVIRNYIIAEVKQETKTAGIALNITVSGPEVAFGTSGSEMNGLGMNDPSGLEVFVPAWAVSLSWVAIAAV